ncbi:MAG: imidazole glycerol phosphate synthase subunit HisH [Lentisphaeria bacterium]
MKISLIDYNMGNLLSVRKAFESVGAEIEIISTVEEVLNAKALILPGVGNFGDGIEHLRANNLDRAIVQKVASGTPLMGICLGMQLLFDSSEEAPGKTGLGIITGNVVQFPLGLRDYKVPKIGWNSVEVVENKDLFSGISNDSYFYFVHSFYCKPKYDEWTACYADYGFRYCAAVNQGNIFATQFHPEKSQDSGLAVLKNYVEYVHKLSI